MINTVACCASTDSSFSAGCSTRVASSFLCQAGCPVPNYAWDGFWFGHCCRMTVLTALCCPGQGGKGFVVAPVSVEDTALPTVAKLAAVLGGSALLLVGAQRLLRQQYPSDSREDAADAYTK